MLHALNKGVVPNSSVISVNYKILLNILDSISKTLCFWIWNLAGDIYEFLTCVCYINDRLQQCKHAEMLLICE